MLLLLADGEGRFGAAAGGGPAVCDVRQEQRRGDCAGDAQLPRDCRLLHQRRNGTSLHHVMIQMQTLRDIYHHSKSVVVFFVYV